MNNDGDGLVEQVLDVGGALRELQLHILRLAVQILEQFRPDSQGWRDFFLSNIWDQIFFCLQNLGTSLILKLIMKDTGGR